MTYLKVTKTQTTLDEAKELFEFKAGMFIWTYMMPVLMVIGSLCSLISIRILMKKKMRKHTTNIYLAAIALLDLLVLTVCLPRGWLQYGMDIFIRLSSNFLCKFHTYLFFLILDASAWVTTAVSLDRALFLTYPVWAKVKLTVRRSVMSCLAAVAFLAIWNLHFFWTVKLSHPELIKLADYDGPKKKFDEIINLEDEKMDGTKCDADHSSALIEAFGEHIMIWLHLAVFCAIPFVIMYMSNMIIVRKLYFYSMLDDSYARAMSLVSSMLESDDDQFSSYVDSGVGVEVETADVQIGPSTHEMPVGDEKVEPAAAPDPRNQRIFLLGRAFGRGSMSNNALVGSDVQEGDAPCILKSHKEVDDVSGDETAIQRRDRPTDTKDLDDECGGTGDTGPSKCDVFAKGTSTLNNNNSINRINTLLTYKKLDSSASNVLLKSNFNEENETQHICQGSYFGSSQKYTEHTAREDQSSLRKGSFGEDSKLELGLNEVPGRVSIKGQSSLRKGSFGEDSKLELGLNEVPDRVSIKGQSSLRKGSFEEDSKLELGLNEVPDRVSIKGQSSLLKGSFGEDSKLELGLNEVPDQVSINGQSSLRKGSFGIDSKLELGLNEVPDPVSIKGGGSGVGSEAMQASKATSRQERRKSATKRKSGQMTPLDGDAPRMSKRLSGDFDMALANMGAGARRMTKAKNRSARKGKLLLVITLFFMVLNLPVIIHWLVFKDFVATTSQDIATEFFALAIVNFLRYLNNASHFFLYCLIAPKFYKELKFICWKKGLKKHCPWCKKVKKVCCPCCRKKKNKGKKAALGSPELPENSMPGSPDGSMPRSSFGKTPSEVGSNATLQDQVSEIPFSETSKNTDLS